MGRGLSWHLTRLITLHPTLVSGNNDQVKKLPFSKPHGAVVEKYSTEGMAFYEH